ncbi:hypothetical protein KKC88_06245 [Patescibacteria group bacterium]|nr:hypothetical protein [Patescibacteria group bacterium]MBU1673918.1 hypothetical protein [Patescibacteria group bacterium]MBU1963912.1 hypothetical protein [Patescibacteria group bacterium]
MATKKIYGVDPDKELTPLEVRDAIVECFYEAHCADSDVAEAGKEASHEYCHSIVEKAFEDTSHDYNNPDKKAIMDVMQQLAEFSRNFRDPKIIEKHYSQIMGLVKKLK